MIIIQEKYKEKSINEKLAKYFKNEVDYRKDLDIKAIYKFYTTSDHDIKFKCVEQIIKKLVESNGKKKIYLHIDKLHKIEKDTTSLTGKRDHVIHALNTYLLGLYINDKYLATKVNEFKWKLTAPFHDIAYPIEIAALHPEISMPMTSKEMVESYIDTMKNIEGVDNFNIIVQNLVPKNVEKLTNKKNAFDYIQNQIRKWGLGVNVQKKYDTMISSNKICHGMFSALTVLHLIDSMYQKHNPERVEEYKPAEDSDWNQEYFENDVVPACSAIFLHNLDKDAFDKIDKNEAPLPYLLKLCDELQNWDRPGGKRKSEPSENYGISIEDGNLIFYVKDKAKIKDIKKRIEWLNDTIDVCPLDKML